MHWPHIWRIQKFWRCYGSMSLDLKMFMHELKCKYKVKVRRIQQ